MSWFDVLKIDPLEYNMRMRERRASKPVPVPEKETEACAKCGESRFMRGDVDPEGRTICALCKKRFYDDAGATA